MGGKTNFLPSNLCTSDASQDASSLRVTEADDVEVQERRGESFIGESGTNLDSSGPLLAFMYSRQILQRRQSQKLAKAADSTPILT